MQKKPHKDENVICLSHIYPWSRREEQLLLPQKSCLLPGDQDQESQAPVDWEPQGKSQDLALMIPLGELLPTINTARVSKQLLPACRLA